MKNSIIYEVNLQIDNNIHKQYLRWLNNHIQQILQFQGFNKAVMLKEETQDNKFHITVHYYLQNRELLQDYLDNHAAQMRQDGIEKFGDQFSASRRIFSIVD